MTKKGRVSEHERAEIQKARQKKRTLPDFMDSAISISDVECILNSLAVNDTHEFDLNSLIFEDAPLNVQDDEGQTSLHLAAALDKNSLAETKDLLRRHADINIEDTEKRTPIYYAVDKKNWDTCEYLLLNGARVQNDISKEKVVQDILEEATKQNFLHNNDHTDFKFEINWAVFHTCDDKYGLAKWNTILHLAVRCEKPDWVEQLIKMGAAVEVSNSKKQTPLHLAIIHQYENNIIDLLLNHKANIDAQDFKKETPLHKAIERRMEGTVSFLLQKGANVNKQDLRGMSPLHSSLILNTDTITRLLLKHGANTNIVNHKKETPLHCTTSEEMIKRLVDNGADVNAMDKKEYTVLHRFIMEDNVKNVQYLLQKGANPKQLDSKGSKRIFPIRYAVNYASTEMVKLFTDTNADGIEDEDREIIYLIQLAVARNQFDTVKLLCTRLKQKEFAPTVRERGNILLQSLSSSSDDIVRLLIEEDIVDVSALISLKPPLKKTPKAQPKDKPDENVKDDDPNVDIKDSGDHNGEVKADDFHGDVEDGNIPDVEDDNDVAEEALYEDEDQFISPVEAARALKREDEIISFMVKHGAHPDDDDDDDNGANELGGEGETKLHESAKGKGRQALVNLMKWVSLVKNNTADRDSEGNTPLHIACAKGRKSVIKYLATKDRDCLYIRNNVNQRPVDIAKLYRPSLKEFLKA